MESISKALAVIGTIGVVCGIMGCIGLFAGGHAWHHERAFRPSSHHPSQG